MSISTYPVVQNMLRISASVSTYTHFTVNNMPNLIPFVTLQCSHQAILLAISLLSNCSYLSLLY